MWFAVACLTVAARTSPTFKNMEGQHKLVEPQRPSTHGQLFASLPITINLIFSELRIEVSSRAVKASILFRPSRTTRHQKSKPILSNGLMRASAREQRATSQSLPTSIGMSGWAGPEPTASYLETRNEDRSAVASATVWIARARRVDLRRGEFSQNGLERRGTEVSRVSDE
jgi:hypothetical protein